MKPCRAELNHIIILGAHCIAIPVGFFYAENMEKQKLELKHLAPYLPYRLKIRQRVRNASGYYYRKGTLTLKNVNWLLTSEIQKPILRPLSDFKNEIYILF